MHIASTKLLQVMDKLGVPLAEEKMEGPTTKLSFGVIELDTVAEESRLPQEKLGRLQELIAAAPGEQKVRLKEIHGLLGHLNFACRVIIPGGLSADILCAATVGICSPHHCVSISHGILCYGKHV